MGNTTSAAIVIKINGSDDMYIYVDACTYPSRLINSALNMVCTLIDLTTGLLAVS